MSIGVKEYDVFSLSLGFYNRSVNRINIYYLMEEKMAYVIAFFVLVFFSIFCGWIVAAMIDEEEARELEELEKKEGKKSLQVQIFELKEEINSSRKIEEELLKAIKENFELIKKLTEKVEQWEN